MFFFRFGALLVSFEFACLVAPFLDSLTVTIYGTLCPAYGLFSVAYARFWFRFVLIPLRAGENRSEGIAVRWRAEGVSQKDTCRHESLKRSYGTVFVEAGGMGWGPRG